MRLTGPLNLTLDGPPELGFYASRAHGGILAFDVFEIVDGAKNPRAEVTLFVPRRLNRAWPARSRRLTPRWRGKKSLLTVCRLNKAARCGQLTLSNPSEI